MSNTKEIIIRINGRVCEIRDSRKLGLALTYGIAGENSLSSRRSATSKTIKLQATKVNKKNFGFPEEINSVDYFTNNENITGSVEVDGTVIISGRVQFKKPVTKDSTEYYFVIQGDNSDWKYRLDHIGMRQLDYSDQDHAYNKGNIDDSETVIAGRHYVYGLVNTGRIGDIYSHRVQITKYYSDVWRIRRLYYNETAQHPAGGEIELYGYEDGNGEPSLVDGMPSYTIGNAAASGIGTADEDYIVYWETSKPTAVGAGWIGLKPNGARSVRYSDRIPAINIAETLKRVYKGIGYKIVSQINDNYFTKLYMLCRENVGTQRGDFTEIQEELFRASMSNDLQTIVDDGIEGGYRIPIDDDSNSPNYDDNDHFNITTYEYLCTRNVRQYFEYKIDLEHLTLTRAIVDIRLKLDRQGTITTLNANQYFGGTYRTGILDLIIGDKVFLDLTYQNHSNITTVFKLNAAGTWLKNVIKDYGEYPKLNSLISLANFLPDTTQLAFVQGLKHLFNLYFVTDVARKIVYIESRDKFYIEDKVIDWSGKLDLSKKVELLPVQSRFNEKERYGYCSDGNDTTVEDIEDATGEPHHSITVETPSVFGSERTKDFYNDYFAPTAMMPTTQQQHTIFGSTKIPKIHNGDTDEEGAPNGKEDFKARILYYEGVQNTNLTYDDSGVKVDDNNWVSIPSTEFNVKPKDDLIFTFKVKKTQVSGIHYLISVGKDSPQTGCYVTINTVNHQVTLLIGDGINRRVVGAIVHPTAGGFYEATLVYNLMDIDVQASRDASNYQQIYGNPSIEEDNRPFIVDYDNLVGAGIGRDFYGAKEVTEEIEIYHIEYTHVRRDHDGVAVWGTDRRIWNFEEGVGAVAGELEAQVDGALQSADADAMWVESRYRDQWRWEGTWREDYPRFYSRNDDGANGVSLAFDNLPDIVGLFDRYYRTSFNERIFGRKLSCYLNLNDVDIAGFANIEGEVDKIGDYRALFFLIINGDGAYFRVHKIKDYDPTSNRTTKVELIKETSAAFIAPLPPTQFMCDLLTVIPTEPVEGAGMTITLDVSNIGAQAGNVQVDFTVTYISGAQQTYTETLLIGTGQTVEILNVFIVPLSEAGTASVLAEVYNVDNGGVLNCSETETFTVVACNDAIDIEALESEITCTPDQIQYEEGDYITLTFKVRNKGCLPANVNTQVRYADANNGGVVYQSKAQAGFVLQGLTERTITYEFTNLEAGNNFTEQNQFIFIISPWGGDTWTQITMNKVVQVVHTNAGFYVTQLKPAHQQTGLPIQPLILEATFNKVPNPQSGTIRLMEDGFGTRAQEQITSNKLEWDLANKKLIWNTSLSNFSILADKRYYVQISTTAIVSGSHTFAGMVGDTHWAFDTNEVAQAGTLDIPANLTSGTLHVYEGGNDLVAAMNAPVADWMHEGDTDGMYFVAADDWGNDVEVQRTFLDFSLASIPVGRTITAVEFKVHGGQFYGGAPLVVVLLKGVQAVPMTVADFQAYTGTPVATLTGYLKDQFNVFTLNPQGIQDVQDAYNLGQPFKLVAMFQEDFNRTVPTGVPPRRLAYWHTPQDSDSALVPLLKVTYS